MIGASNDWSGRDRDAVGGRDGRAVRHPVTEVVSMMHHGTKGGYYIGHGQAARAPVC